MLCPTHARCGRCLRLCDAPVNLGTHFSVCRGSCSIQIQALQWLWLQTDVGDGLGDIALPQTAEEVCSMVVQQEGKNVTLCLLRVLQ